jgi:phosphoserine phosphatase
MIFGLYAFGLRHVDDLIRLGALQSRGHREQDIVDWYQRFWDEEIRSLVRPGARAAVEQHRAGGDRTAIITSSTIYIARLAAADLGIDDALAPRMLVVTLLEQVGRPVAVNPDPRLRRVARRRKWAIVDWGR